MTHDIAKIDNYSVYRRLGNKGGYFMTVCSIVKTITPTCRGRPDALLHEAEGRVQ